MWGIKRQPKDVQTLFHTTQQEWLEGARVTARRLLQTFGTVTIEDVLQVYPRPNYLSRNITGSVFRDGSFVAVGYVNSKRSVSRANIIRTWRLKDDREY